MLLASSLFALYLPLAMKCDMMSMGKGKMMVEFFSAEMLVKVWR